MRTSMRKISKDKEHFKSYEMTYDKNVENCERKRLRTHSIFKEYYTCLKSGNQFQGEPFEEAKASSDSLHF